MATHVAVVAADVVEVIHPLGRSQHPYVEVVVAKSFLATVAYFPAAVAYLPAATSVIVLTLVYNLH